MSKDLCPFSRQPCMKDDCHMWMWVETVDEITGSKTRNDVCSLNAQSFMLNDMIRLLKQNTGYTQQIADAEQRRTQAAEYLTNEARKRLTQ